ncbi:TonB-dependent receptor plug domain-containing protein, partial [Desulfobacter sp.]|uniref:TonB-dependent receptor plug domain-containing protein n=1 Tax=Desulfobacter sp. TaxID=2294 RepID=UPI003D11247A
MGMISRITGFIMILLLWFPAGPVLASDTMLMFVGEDLEVLSIASRREEAAWSAPAIAEVITREEIENKAAVTLSQALEDRPGFYMNPTEKGTVPYLRGIQNSALFLFDTVPMGSGIRKSDSMIDYETSLAPVKRIEVIRGTGSVLWGADAFAGVVNAVPLSGRDFQGVETGLLMASEHGPGEAYMNWGARSSDWTGFVSVSGRRADKSEDPYNVVRFWGDGKAAEPLESRYGTGEPDDSHFVNLYASVGYSDWLTLSARVADNKNAYAVSDWDGTYSWEEQTANTSGQYKIEASRRFSPDSGIRFTGYYSENRQDQSFVDKTFDVDESSWFGEIIYDHSLFNNSGLVTVGSSFKHDDFQGIPVWDNFLPNYVTDANIQIAQNIVSQISEDNSLKSFFGQYRHDLDRIEVWAGIRYDDHEAYEDRTSYNAGFAWDLGQFKFKTLYGTAYRSPFAWQLQESGGDSLERIRNINTQISWKHQETRAALTLFQNKISNHVIEDRYKGAGLPTANSQTINGVELEISHKFFETFSISGNLTLLDNSGPKETYFYHDYNHYDGDGKLIEEHYQTLEYAYDTGPKTMGNLQAKWQMTDHLTLIPELRYFSRRTLYYPESDVTRTQACPEAWIVDVNLKIKDILPFDITLFVNNLFDNEYLSPGLYSIYQ